VKGEGVRVGRESGVGGGNQEWGEGVGDGGGGNWGGENREEGTCICALHIHTLICMELCLTEVSR